MGIDRMFRDLLAPIVTLVCIIAAGILSLDKLCQFYQIYQSITYKLESEKWLLRQCVDPVFFSNMHPHTDICFSVENNARVGAFMLALRQMTQSFQIHQTILQLDPRPFTWSCLVILACTLLFCPSLILSNARTVRR